MDYVDLGSSVNINNVTLRWGSAYATAYGVYVWNGSIWQNVYSQHRAMEELIF